MARTSPPVSRPISRAVCRLLLDACSPLPGLVVAEAFSCDAGGGGVAGAHELINRKDQNQNQTFNFCFISRISFRSCYETTIISGCWVVHVP